MNCGLRTIHVWNQNLAVIVCYFTIRGNLKGTYNNNGPLISSLLYTDNSMVVTREGRELEGVVKELKYKATEDGLTLGIGHTMQGTDSCIGEMYT